MRSHRFPAWILVPGILLVAYACGGTNLPDRVEYSTDLRDTVRAHVKPGSTITEAVTWLEAEGFTCQPTVSRPFVGMTDTLTFAYCDGHAGKAKDNKRYQLALLDSSGVFTEVIVASGSGDL